MNVRRLAAVVSITAVALVPSLGRAVLDPASPVSGSACTVGDEVLAYNGAPPAPLGWTIQADVKCTAGYTDVIASVRMTQITGVSTIEQGFLAGPTIFALTSHSCTLDAGYNGSCSISTVQAPRNAQGVLTPRPTLADGLYEVRASAYIRHDDGFGNISTFSGTHASCFLAHAYAVTPIQGCTF